MSSLTNSKLCLEKGLENTDAKMHLLSHLQLRYTLGKL